MQLQADDNAKHSGNMSPRGTEGRCQYAARRDRIWMDNLQEIRQKLEENALHSVCRALREYLERPCREDELEDEILERYHIVRERQKLCLKGNMTIRIAGRELELGIFADGVEFFADELERLEWIHIHTPHFMTVENRTSWLRLSIPDAALFYLGGYCVRPQRDFLKKFIVTIRNLFFGISGTWTPAVSISMRICAG